MHDVLGEIVLAGRDEDLRAGDHVAAVALRHGLAAQHSEIGAAMRFGEVHGAGPGAGNHLRQVGGFLLGRTVHIDRGDRPLSEARIHGEGHVGRAEKFVDDLGHHRRQPLAAELHGSRDADPAAVRELPVGLLEPLGRGDARVLVPRAALGIADGIERG